MRARPTVGGIALLVLGGMLAAAVLDSYLAIVEATAAFALVPLSLLVIAIILVGAGAVLLYSAWSSIDALASRVHDPHHAPPIRSPVLPLREGGGNYMGGGVTVDQDDSRREGD